MIINTISINNYDKHARAVEIFVLANIPHDQLGYAIGDSKDPLALRSWESFAVFIFI